MRRKRAESTGRTVGSAFVAKSEKILRKPICSSETEVYGYGQEAVVYIQS